MSDCPKLPHSAMNRAATINVPSVKLQTSSRSWVFTDVLLPFLVTRLGLSLIAWLGFQLAPLRVTFPGAREIGANKNWQPVSVSVSPREHPWLNMWSRWDATWYVEVAESGYQFESGKPSTAAFFPLYPLLIRAFDAVLLLPSTQYWWLMSGLIVSNACLLIALLYLRALLLLDYGENVAARVILYILVFPTTFFLSA